MILYFFLGRYIVVSDRTLLTGPGRLAIYNDDVFLLPGGGNAAFHRESEQPRRSLK